MPFNSSTSRLKGLYVITDERLGGGHLAITRAALKGGAGIIQLRDKSTPMRELVAVARIMRLLTREKGALLIMNDRLDLAQLCEADGVHLGPDDCPLADARRLLGPHHLLGASCGTVDEALAAREAGADYIGVGAVFPTGTKTDAGTAIGLDGLRQVAGATDLPVAAIGGITELNIGSVCQENVAMACVISAITGAGNEEQMAAATARLAAMVQTGRK